MKAAVYYENGGPEVFKYEEVADPPLSHFESLTSGQSPQTPIARDDAARAPC